MLCLCHVHTQRVYRIWKICKWPRCVPCVHCTYIFVTHTRAHTSILLQCTLQCSEKSLQFCQMSENLISICYTFEFVAGTFGIWFNKCEKCKSPSSIEFEFHILYRRTYAYLYRYNTNGISDSKSIINSSSTRCRYTMRVQKTYCCPNEYAFIASLHCGWMV